MKKKKKSLEFIKPTGDRYESSLRNCPLAFLSFHLYFFYQLIGYIFPLTYTLAEVRSIDNDRLLENRRRYGLIYVTRRGFIG